MKSVKQLLIEQISKYPEFEYYLPIIEKIEKNLNNQPDISIEASKALIEGISKSIIEQLDGQQSREELNYLDLSPLVKKAASLLQANDDQYEIDFTNRCVSLVYALGVVRNKRSDISHGRAVPKEYCSKIDFADLVVSMTDAILVYMLRSFFDKIGYLKQEREQVSYEENQDFNDYLDEVNQLEGKPLYSLALYQQYYEDYILQLEDYNYNTEFEAER